MLVLFGCDAGWALWWFGFGLCLLVSGFSCLWLPLLAMLL